MPLAFLINNLAKWQGRENISFSAIVQVGQILWHINPCKLFNAKSCLCIY